MLKNFALAGFRSFGPQPQFLEKLEKVNLLIGTNNSGKSNVLRLLHAALTQNSAKFDGLDHHIGGKGRIFIGAGQGFTQSSSGTFLPTEDCPVFERLKEPHLSDLLQTVGQILANKAKIDKSTLAWSLWTRESKHLAEGWKEACRSVDSSRIYRLWSILTNRQGGDFERHWIPEVIQALQLELPHREVHLVPAIREVDASDISEQSLSGRGLILRLAKLQNPDAYNQADKDKFFKVRDFLRAVTHSPSAELEVPHDRRTLIVHMNDRSLPLEFLGSGIHEVIILAAAATVVSNAIICIEEPELHLNPLLQRKFLQYLERATNNQYFIATHSPVFMDLPGAEIYNVRLTESGSSVKRVTTGRHRREICEDLGYHPSDLLQANCVIWVEGPSDRIYLRHWLDILAPELYELIHYSIMFYGGRLASHLTNCHLEETADNLISLRRLNSRSSIVIDSDKSSSRARTNSTKKRLKSEFDEGPGHAWITYGREIENYLNPSDLKESILACHPKVTLMTKMGQFDNCLTIKSKKGNVTQANKVAIAHHYVSNHVDHVPDNYDLRKRLRLLISFIKESNPRRS